MASTGFQKAADAALRAIETAVERAMTEANADLDIEIERTDNVLTLEFEDGAKVIVNSHSAAGEIWVAARSGGFHFRPAEPGRWVDTRSGEDLFAALSRLLGGHAGTAIQLKP